MQTQTLTAKRILAVMTLSVMEDAAGNEFISCIQQTSGESYMPMLASPPVNAPQLSAPKVVQPEPEKKPVAPVTTNDGEWKGSARQKVLIQKCKDAGKIPEGKKGCHFMKEETLLALLGTTVTNNVAPPAPSAPVTNNNPLAPTNNAPSRPVKQKDKVFVPLTQCSGECVFMVKDKKNPGQFIPTRVGIWDVSEDGNTFFLAWITDKQFVNRDTGKLEYFARHKDGEWTAKYNDSRISNVIAYNVTSA